MAPNDFSVAPLDPNALQRMFSQSNSTMDYSSHFNDMMAPYSDMAKQFQSPYAMFRPNSWIAQNHPQMAKILDSVGLAAAMTPGPQGPEGAGQGISRAFQGLLGANQYRRQQMLQSAMLPYQMAMPRLQAEDVMSQIAERRSMVPFRESQEIRNLGYYQSIEERERHNRETEDAARQDAKTESELEDRMAWGMMKDGPKDRTQATPEQYQEYLKNINLIRASKRGAGGGTSETERMVDAEDKERVARGLPPFTATERNNRIVGFMGAFSGARTGGSQGAPHAFAENKDFYDREMKWAYDSLNTKYPALTPSQFQEQHLSDPEYWKPGNQQKMYDAYNSQRSAAKAQLDKDAASYRKSGAWSRSVPYSEFQANPQKYSAVPSNAGVDTSGKPQITVENPFPEK